MKPFKASILFCLLLIATVINAQPACENRNSSGSLVMYGIQEHGLFGYGAAIGEEGILSPISWFLGVDVLKGPINKTDTSIAFMSAKIIWRLNDAEAPIKFGIVGGGGMRNQDITYLFGIRVLHVITRNIAFSAEPLFTQGMNLRTQFNFHILL